MKIFLGIIVFIMTCSCANYIKNMHKQLDASHSNEKRYSLYEKYGNRNSQRVKTTGNENFVSPGIKRYYQPKKNMSKRKRYTASDFDDNLPNGSFWLASSGRNRDFLFSKNVNVRSGDIVLIQVQEKLKNEISDELKREFPLARKRMGTVKVEASVEKHKEESASTQSPAQPQQKNNKKIYDVISSVVVGEVDENHLVVKGEKSILFRNQKRLVEVQALVKRQHIEPDGSLASDRIIENQIHVTRRLQ